MRLRTLNTTTSAPRSTLPSLHSGTFWYHLCLPAAVATAGRRGQWVRAGDRGTYMPMCMCSTATHAHCDTEALAYDAWQIEQTDREKEEAEDSFGLDRKHVHGGAKQWAREMWCSIIITIVAVSCEGGKGA